MLTIFSFVRILNLKQQSNILQVITVSNLKKVYLATSFPVLNLGVRW